MSATLDLWDYRRRVSEIYARVREGQGIGAWERWREERDQLFAHHPQTPIEATVRFTGLPYFPYDPGWRITGALLPEEDETLDVGHSGEGATSFLRVGTVQFEAKGRAGRLGLYWLTGYGGGVFLPFRDLTNGDLTYGGGRYLLDSAKGADLGHDGDLIVLDFNYAYHPSCVHSSRWSCPLAPAENRLDFPVTAGERLPGPA
ncbi:MAG: DUF1684 domain-containing protein [Actinobacteria bacterium]|nr:DUF1684 domain-containing protein [Actinomycetota bacterium]